MKPYGLEAGLAILWLGFLGLQAILVSVDTGRLDLAVLSHGIYEARYYAYLAMGFMCWVDILRRTTREEFWGFVSKLAGMTTVLMVPYMLAAVGFKVYGADAYQTLIFGSRSVVRDFLTFPWLTRLALAYYVSKILLDRATWLRMLCVIVLTVGILLTVTRGYVLAFGMLVLVAWALALVRRGGLKRLWVPVAMTLALAFGGLLLTLLAAPNVAFLSSRMAQLTQGLLADTNFAYRVSTFRDVSAHVARVDPVFGLSPVGAGVKAVSSAVGRVYIFGDFMWTQAVVFLGFAGVIGIACLLFASMLASARLAASRVPERAAVGLLVLLMLVFEAARTFGSEGYFWFFSSALLSVAILDCEWRSMWRQSPRSVAEAAAGHSPYRLRLPSADDGRPRVGLIGPGPL